MASIGICPTNKAFEFNQRFPGQYFDKETNTHYNYYCDYDSNISRYVESDPIGLAGGVNTYAYVDGNSLRWADRFGLDPGDLYQTVDDAAIDAANFARRQPRNRIIEYGRWILRVGKC